MTELIAEINRRADEAMSTPQGADFQAIIDDVAEENGVGIDDLRIAWMDSLITEPN